MKLNISPSNFGRAYACPGSAQLCADIKVESNAAMERGTKLHAQLLELFTGREQVTKKTVGTLTTALGLLLKARKELADAQVTPVIEYLEARLDFEWAGLDLDKDRGRVDYAFVGETSGMVIDFKTGRGSDEYDRPAESWQLRLYAAALSLQHPEVKTWCLAYCAPERESGPIWTEAWLDDEDLDEVRALAAEAVRAAKKKNPEFRQGEHCKWCPGKSKCPAMKSNLPAVGGDDGLPALVDRFEAMAPTGRAELWTKVLAAEEWVAAVKADLIKLAAGGCQVEGYEAKPYRIDKRWADEETAERVLKVALGEKAYEKKLIGPVAALKLGFVDDANLIAEVPSAVTLKRRK